MLKEEFQELIAEAVEEFDVRTLANAFGVSLPTVRRWAEGVTSPISFIREHVVKALSALRLEALYKKV